MMHLTNIFHNLFDNAMKFGPEIPVIRISTFIRANRGTQWDRLFRRGLNSVCIRFSDNGAGIDPKYRKRIFHKFFRIPSGNVHDVKGFGLGLYYVRLICNAHGWKISLESDTTAGKGATFLIMIPGQ
jgi:two-component system phosphate regulon sensor histidine kinase PhoR